MSIPKTMLKVKWSAVFLSTYRYLNWQILLVMRLILNTKEKLYRPSYLLMAYPKI